MLMEVRKVNQGGFEGVLCNNNSEVLSVNFQRVGIYDSKKSIYILYFREMFIAGLMWRVILQMSMLECQIKRRTLGTFSSILRVHLCTIHGR